MLNLISYTNNVSNFSGISTSRSNSTEDVLSLIRALRNERSEDIKDRIIGDLQKKKAGNKNNTTNKPSHEAAKLK